MTSNSKKEKAKMINESDPLAQRVADLFAPVAIGHRGHSIAADRIADVDDGSETRIHDHKRLGGYQGIEGVPPGGVGRWSIGVRGLIAKFSSAPLPMSRPTFHSVAGRLPPPLP